MKRVTASEARRHWFRILDEVAQGEVVFVERGGRRIVLRCETEETQSVPNYRELLQVPDAEEADPWGWEWVGPGQELVAKD